MLLITGCGAMTSNDTAECTGDGICYRIVDGYVTIEGDIIVGTEADLPDALDRVRSGFAVHESAAWARWPNKKVPYVINARLPDIERVQEAIAHFHAHTNIKFIPRTTHSAYVVFKPWDQGYCRSWIGRTGSAQAIELDVTCDTRLVIHEIGHAVGLYHEHTRKDRDQYVKIIRDNIISGQGSNFNKQTTYARIIGPYDFFSVMHYRYWEMSKNGLPTITRLDGSTDLSNPDGLSAGDIAALKAMYP